MRFIDSNVLAYAFYENENREKSQEIIKNGGIINTVNLIEAYNIIQLFIDMVHYTTSLLCNCQEIASYDSDFDNLDIKRVIS